MAQHLNGFSAMLWGQSARTAILRVQSAGCGHQQRPTAKAPKAKRCNNGGGKDIGSRRQDDYGFCRTRARQLLEHLSEDRCFPDQMRVVTDGFLWRLICDWTKSRTKHWKNAEVASGAVEVSGRRAARQRLRQGMPG
jgi:hypothetical protein